MTNKKKSFEIKKGNTSISEHARRALDISRDEYALCAYMHYRQASPSQKVPGWCCDEKDEIAWFVGLTRQGLHKMVLRMESKKLLEVSGTNGAIRATQKWENIEASCKQSFRESLEDSKQGHKQSLRVDVNKVYDETIFGVNKVSGNIKVKKEINSKIGSEIREANTTPHTEIFPTLETDLLPETSGRRAGVEKSALEAEKKQSPPGSAAPPIFQQSQIPPDTLEALEEQSASEAREVFAAIEKSGSAAPRPAPPGTASNSPAFHEFVKAETPDQLLAQMRAFYDPENGTGRHEWEAIMSNTIAGLRSAKQRKETTEAFATWAISKGGYDAGGQRWRNLNARFRQWWVDEKNKPRATPEQWREHGTQIRHASHQPTAQPVRSSAPPPDFSPIKYGK